MRENEKGVREKASATAMKKRRWTWPKIQKRVILALQQAS
jgi:hypothetical protein